MYAKYIKRILDFILSLIALIVLSPVLLVVAILVRIKLGSPIIFKQQRPGKDERIFTLYKFRTMTDKKDENGNLLPDSERLTKFGKVLRSTSLDELPELVNILKGDMSIVGPRPLLIRDMLFMTDEQRKRHTVRQGLTGLAQINGRNNINWEEKLEYDLQYIKNITFVGDVKIIFKTVLKVLKRDDINTDGMDTAEDLCDYLLRTNKITEKEYKEKLKNYKFPSVSYELADMIEKKSGAEVRVVVPGHTQRGGSPCPYDRVLCSRLGAAAAQAIMDEDYGNMIAMVNGKTKRVPLGDVAGKLKSVDPECQMIKEAKSMGISFGD